MDAEQFRALALALPYAEETRQWGNNLVFWVGHKAVGGKMFALVDLDFAERGGRRVQPVVSFPVGAENFDSLLEQEGVVPAPYLARAGWVALERWDALEGRELRRLLEGAHALVAAKLPARTRALLKGPKSDYRKAVAERKLPGAGAGVKSRPRTRKDA